MRVFMGVLAFLFLVFMLVVVCVFPHVKRKRDDLGDMEPIVFDKDVIQPSHTIFHKSACELQDALYESVRHARSQITLSTYRWRVELHQENHINRHILALGYALKEASEVAKTNQITIPFRILCNQFLVSKENNGFVKQQIDLTYRVWEKIGFIPSSPGVIIEFRTWRHVTLGNIHDKFLLVDDSTCMLYSMNIEGYSHGEEGSWMECGVELNSPHTVQSLQLHFQEYWDHAHVFDFSKRNEKEDPTMDWEWHYEVEKQSSYPRSIQANVVVKSNIPQGFAFGRHNPIMLTLIPLLQHAKSHICILTPNFNDVSIMNALVKHTDIPIRVIMSKRFNVDVPFLQQLILGWTTNEWFIRAMDDSQIVFRWNGWKGEPVTGKSDYALHAKMILIDDILCVGSLNCDTYSTITSGETVLFLRSAELVQNALDTLFEPLWHSSLPLIPIMEQDV